MKKKVPKDPELALMGGFFEEGWLIYFSEGSVLKPFMSEIQGLHEMLILRIELTGQITKCEGPTVKFNR